MQKAQADIQKATAVNGHGKDTSVDGDVSGIIIHEDGTVRTSPDDNASTRGMLSPSSPTGPLAADGNDGPVPIPTIRVSTESDRATREETLVGHSSDNGESQGNGPQEIQGLEKPVQAAASEEKDSSDPSTASHQEPFSFSNKRLCERWLDNLFMVLYEDLRVWTIFRAEVVHFKTQHVAYRKTGLEWEILGDLGMRLHHREEAKEAYQRCLDAPRYSAKPWLKLMQMYAEEGDIQRTIQTAIRVAAYQYAEYTEMTFPTHIARSFFKLGQLHGHAKIKFTLLSMGLPEPILKIMESYSEYGKTFKIEGSDF